MFKTRSKVFSDVKTRAETSTSAGNKLYNQTRVHESLNFDSFLENSLRTSEIEILKKTQLRLEHHLADASLKKHDRTKIHQKLEKTLLTFEKALECQNQIDVLGLFEGSRELSKLTHQDSFEQEIRIEAEEEEGLAEMDQLGMADQERLLERAELLTRDFLSSLRTQEFGDEVASRLDAELRRNVLQSFSFLKRNNLACVFDKLEVDETASNVQSIEEFLLVDCDVVRRRNGPRQMYLTKSNGTGNSFTIKKKKLTKHPLVRKVTRMALDVTLKVEGSIRFVAERGSEAEVVPSRTIRRIESTLKVPVVFENLSLQHKFRPLMRQFRSGQTDSAQALVYKNLEHFQMVDFNESLNGNFFFK